MSKMAYCILFLVYVVYGTAYFVIMLRFALRLKAREQEPRVFANYVIYLAGLGLSMLITFCIILLMVME